MSRFSRSNSNKLNILCLLIFAIGIFALLMFRTGSLMLKKESDGVDLVEYTAAPTERSSISEAKRGSIYDRKGQPIALDTTSYSMYALLNANWTEDVIADPDRTAQILSEYIDLSRDEILDILLQEDVAQAEFGQAGANLSLETKEAIEETDLPGIYFTAKTKRKYVNPYFASHLIGYASVLESADELAVTNLLEGQMGVELAYDQKLSGQENGQIVDGRLIGEDITLTLDSRLQNQVEDIMQKAYEKYQPENVMAFIVDARTGDLCVAAQRPSFNLNTLEGIEEEWRNLLVEESLEPGSTMKVLTQAVAIDNQLYQTNETFLSGTIDVYDQKVHDYNLTGWGQIPFEEGFARSSNVAMVHLVNRLGLEEWTKYLEMFGFGQTTNSGLPNEVAGTVDFDNPVNATMSAFGQGLLTSPIQLLQAYSSIGNKGEMLKVQYIQDTSQTEAAQGQVLGQPISQEAADKVLALMVNTVEAPYGTAQSFRRNDMSVAAKTGTAQIADPNGSGYLTGPNDYYHSVVTFLPAQDPQYMVYIAMKRPKVNHGLIGSQIIAEIFHGIVNQMMFE
ncbi:hypothetical protein CL176_08170 [Suicoccus acidiformans]|uniref:Penicillin-binding protein n=2 Tax=Suicoccus acidiformans TaxID=2036206 RepID=A0A347WLL8_9LACT|nr:hypothetical protein CL176_08170 [Suicoccus acidiformans]